MRGVSGRGIIGGEGRGVRVGEGCEGGGGV